MSGTNLSKLAAATLCLFLHHSNNNLSNNFSTVSSFVYPKTSTIPSSTRPPAANWIDEKPPLLFWNQILLSSPLSRSTPHQGNLQAARKPNQSNNFNRSSNGDQSSPSKRLPNPDKLTKEEKEQSLQYLASLIKRRLRQIKDAKQSTLENDVSNDLDSKQREKIESAEFVTEEEDVAYQLAKGRFIDLATTVKGEKILEDMFRTPVALAASESLTSAADDTQESKDVNNEMTGNNDDNSNNINNSDDNIDTIQTPTDPRLIKHAITSLQSLLLYAMQIGIKGPTEMQNKLVRHLFRPGDAPQEESGTWIPEWNGEAIRRFKFFRDTELGKDVLAALIWKRTAQGARDLMVELGVWGRHEDTALLRSGFPIRFLEEEERVSKEAENNTHDPDRILGLRKDLRNFKVYTIDGDSTLDIDDGISVEVLKSSDDKSNDTTDPDNSQRRYRYWIHIADVDRWAPRGSPLLKAAERRGTSLYLATSTLCMFPPNMSSGVMSLESYDDKHALSLGVELNTDGSIIPSSILVTPSMIQVDYRLSYDQVDEMLDEGVGYTEEWQIGAMLEAATKRRAHRVAHGSTEGMVPFPIPKGVVSAEYDEEKGDYDVSLKIETTHNSGANVTLEGEGDDPYASPVSSSQLIVTEMMIMAGEAIGKWHQAQTTQEITVSDGLAQLPNELKLPYRRQPAPDFKSREAESRHMDFLYAMNKRYPHAWYARRFFNSVQVSEDAGPHFGMGLECYVQWTSPIRRLTDLQVHAALKRYLRKKRINLLIQKGIPIPADIASMDVGCDITQLREYINTASEEKDNSITSSDKVKESLKFKTVDYIDYSSGLGMIFAARPIQSSSSSYWHLEYIRRLVDESIDEVMFESVVLGCVNQERCQYAIYVYALGLEHRYVSETGKLEEGKKLWLKVSSVNPKMGLLTFSLASKSGGIHAQPTSAPAA
mmetsp:Transcript_25864/g.54155  ORF Transcript_25864/g.54155 Transcript_25864/m.54155 type:complete len:939 (-) Transcript_25864:346-3162(-)